MRRLFLLLACLGLCVPIAAVHWPVHAQNSRVSPGFLGLDSAAQPPFSIFDEARRGETLGQVRVQRRVIIRIAPSDETTRTALMAELPRRAMQTNFAEIPHEECIAIADIRGVRATQDDRLLLFTKENEILTASLQRSCSARAFYSGFYVERSDDGRLCARRDQLQSRTGSTCAVREFTRLVAVAG